MGMGTNARMKLAAAGTLLLSLSSFAAHAATLTVSTLVDSGPGSLRDAITLAAAGDTIDFTSGLRGTILLASSLSLDKGLTILGNPGVILDGNNLVRPVTVAAVQVSLSELTIQRGAAADGAGIFSAGTLVLTDVVLRNNHASNRGGALFVSAGRFALQRVELSDNSAVADGGALMDVGTGASSIANSRMLNNVSGAAGGAIRHVSRQLLTISNSVISGNAVTALPGPSLPTVAQGGGISSEDGLLNISGSTISGNKAFYGGGIHVQIRALLVSRLDLSESAIINNTALSDGGGLFIFGATLNSTNNTLSNNVAAVADGGAIAIDWSGLFFPTVRLTNNTIAYNRAAVNGGGVSVAIGAANDTLTIKSSVIVRNASASDPDLQGDFTSLGFNLVGTRGTSSGYIGSDLANGTPSQLGNLRFNGGPSLSIAPSATSPLVNVIPAANCAGIARDQRGYQRPPANCDIGALELEGVLPPNELFANGFE